MLQGDEVVCVFTVCSAESFAGLVVPQSMMYFYSMDILDSCRKGLHWLEIRTPVDY